VNRFLVADKDSTWPTQNQNWERSDQPKSATDEELQPKPFQNEPFEVNPLAGRYRSQF